MSPLRSRIVANDEWFAHCGRLFIEGNRSNGKYARELREQAGISLRTLAKSMGLSAPFLSDLERGNRQWSASAAEKWEAAMITHGIDPTKFGLNPATDKDPINPNKLKP
jgi:transcriptional regulator with XRE-family HTH domain